MRPSPPPSLWVRCVPVIGGMAMQPPVILLTPPQCCHAVFMLSWFTTRVFMFPAFVIRSTLFESMVLGPASF